MSFTLSMVSHMYLIKEELKKKKAADMEIWLSIFFST